MTAEQLKASVLQAAFEGELTSAWREKNGLTMESWRHVKFADLGTAHLGKMLDKAKNVGTPVRYLRNVNVRWFDFDMSDILEMRVTEEEQIKLQAKPGDLFICEGGEPGRCAVWRDESQQIVFQKALHRFRPNKNSDSDFVSFYIYWLSLNGTLSSFFTGTTIKHLTGKALAEVPVSLPTLNEQKQIIIEINKFLPLIEDYGKAHSALKNAEEALPDKLRASLLQEAIQGKLVPQLDNEPAVDIAGEEPEEVPFAIPEKWKWASLETLFVFVDYRGKTPTKALSGVRLMTASNVRKGYIDHTRVEFISEEEFANRQSRGISCKGDILFTTEAPLGNAALADLEVYSAGQRVITLQSDFVDKQLYVYFLISPYFQKLLAENATGTTAQGIKAAKLKKLLLPVPPLVEQRRIVARLEELLPHVDAIAGLR